MSGVLQMPVLASSTMILPLQVMVAVGAIVFAVLMKRFSRRGEEKLNLPPGPRPWPIVGNLLQLGPVPHKTVAELTAKYGPISFLKLGWRPAVVCTDPEVMHEILKAQDHVFSSRPDTITGRLLTYGGHDFVMAPYGHHWRSMRRVTVLQLLSTKRLESFEPTRRQEARVLVRDVAQVARRGEDVDLRYKIETFAMNNITDMILGKKFFGTQAAEAAGQVNDNDEVLHLLMESFQYFGVLNVSDFIPWLAPLDLQGFARITKKLHSKLDVKMQAIIDEHRDARRKRTELENQTYRKDFVDVLLDVPGENGADRIEDTTIKAMILNMMYSGIDVPVNICEWAIAELVCQPLIQHKLQAEMDAVVGRDRAVEESDFANLPYLKCVVKEVFRLHPAGPFGIPRMNLVPAKVMGYDIPAFTTVMFSNTELGMSRKLWSDPEAFRPERWENSNLATLQDPDLRINPFGLGRRSCPGAGLGSAVTLLCIATLVQHFSWAPAHGLSCHSIDMRVNMAGLMPMLSTLKPLASPRLSPPLYPVAA